MEPTPPDIAARYRRFATDEARGSSALYEQLALHVASSEPLLAFLAAVPAACQQPNLFFAAVRLAARVPQNGGDLEALVATHHAQIGTIMRTRTTQTNEPNRCAVLLPALARLSGPLALIEVGASAGLCLLPDRYGYDYGRSKLVSDTTAPVFPCHANDAAPLPQYLPDIVWRAGIDLNPLDVTSQDDMEWLRTLVWPGQEPRAERLAAAIATAQRDPPRVAGGNLLHDFAALASDAPKSATLVVFHSAVLAYLEPRDRDAFREAVSAIRATWISNEAHGVFPDIAAKAPPPPHPGAFLLAVNGEGVAWTGPHGQWIEWFAR